MVDIATREISSCDLKDAVNKFIPGVIATEIQRSTTGIYPLHDVYVRKVKVLRKPRFDLQKLMELHGEKAATEAGTGDKVSRPEGYEPPVLEAV